MTTKRILIVDDEDDIREVAKLSLELMGAIEVIPASSGHEALEKARLELPDAILLDVMMPDMDGPATFHHLQAQAETRAIPVVLLTAKVQSSDRRQFADLGVQGVIAKPFDPMQLAEQVCALLGWRA
ncbi:MAG TPA: response regulator [Stenomitos sp.]